MPAKTSKKPTIQADCKPPSDGTPPTGGPPPAETIRQAIEELGLNRPFYTCRVVGNRLEFSVYGGDLVYWPPKRARQGRGGSRTAQAPPSGRSQEDHHSSPSGRGPHSVGLGREE